MTSLLWYDLETWGLNTRQRYPAQFAAVRTDTNLNIIDEPLVLYAVPPVDRLPSPEACLITKQTPQSVLAQNHLSDVDFICQINAMMSEPNTCTVGYNNLRFDDEVIRFSLFRNLLDPYAREWQNGCSRWDLLDVLRMAATLRPDGINWPLDERGNVSFRLEDLTHANQITHDNAHDALADVYATINMAKLLKTHQPKLYQFAWDHKSKSKIKSMLNPSDPKILLHVSGMYPKERGHSAIIYPIAEDPNNPNGVVVYDLSVDPAILQSDDIEYLNYLLYTKSDNLKAGEQRLPIKTAHVNKCPIFAPISTLSEETQQKYGIDLLQCKQHAEVLQTMSHIPEKIQQIMSYNSASIFKKVSDPELALYESFPDKRDAQTRRHIHQNLPDAWGDVRFHDPRYEELLFRFKARNYPNFLSNDEKSRWQQHCQDCIQAELPEFEKTLLFLRNKPEFAEQQEIVDQLTQWPSQLSIISDFEYQND